MQLIFVGNPKGGTGKSFFAASLVDHLVNKSEPVMLIDSDTSNPDTSRRFTKDGEVKVELLNLREHASWIQLLNVVHARAQETPKNGAIVVNLPAGIDTAFNRELDAFSTGLKSLEIKTSMFWVGDRSPDTVNLLKLALPKLTSNSVRTVFVKNLHWGDAEKFSIWDKSNTKNDFLKGGGTEVELPELEDTITETVWHSVTPRRFTLAAAELEFGSRVYLEAHLQNVAKALDPLFSAPSTPKAKAAAAS